MQGIDHEIIAALGRELIHHLRGHSVQRTDDALPDGYDALMAAAGVVRHPVRTVELGFLGIFNLGVRCDQTGIHCRRVDADGLDGGAGRPFSISCATENAAFRLLADAAAHGHNVARAGICDHNGGVEQAAIAVRKVFGVGVVFINNFLNAGIDCGIDGITAGDQKILCDFIGAVLDLHNRCDGIFNHGVLKPGINAALRVGGTAGVAVMIDKFQMLGHSLAVFRLTDVSLAEHFSENDFLAFLIALLIGVRAVHGGVVGNADDAGSFRQGELRRRLAEVIICRGVDAVAPMAEIDDVQVPLHNFFFCIILLQLQRLENFQQLALNGDIVVAGVVFDDLLRQSGAAVGVAHAQEHVQERGGGTVPVHAVVLIKAFVLNGNDRVLHLLRDILIVNPDTVLGALQRRKLFIFSGDGIGIINNRCLIDIEFAELQIQFRRVVGLDIGHKDAHEDDGGGHKNQQHCNQDAKGNHQNVADGIRHKQRAAL